VYLIKTGERSLCGHAVHKCLMCCTTNVGYEYTPVWVENTDFDEIVVSPTDYISNRVCVELERVAEAFGVDMFVGFSSGKREGAEEDRRRKVEGDPSDVVGIV